MLRRSRFVPVARIGRSVPESRCAAPAPSALVAMLIGFNVASPAHAGGTTPIPKIGIPQPCGGGVCGTSKVANLPFAQVPGSANMPTWNAGTNTLTIQQNAAKAILNWSGFDIAAGNHVVFVQPSSASVALNQIWQGNTSRILGALSANGQIYLINQNGILFGNGAQVSVGGLLASSLNIDTSNFLSGGVFSPANSLLPLLQDGVTANSGAAGSIMVEAGANITAADSSRIFLAAPNVTNVGTLSAPNGQVILAAGGKIYVQQPLTSDSTTRGLIVTVDDGNQKVNAAGAATNSGTVTATHGNITIAGLTVNQQGQLNATTSVNFNGSVYLTAGTGAIAEGGGLSRGPTKGGTLTLGAGSVTAATPDLADTATAVDTQLQAPGTVALGGLNVQLQSGAQVLAPSGKVTITAAANLNNPPLPSAPAIANGQATNGLGTIILDDGARIDVSGTQDVAVPVTRNFVQAQLLGNELQDSPLERNGFLYQKNVTIDIRGVDKNGDIPIANVAGYVDSIGRTVAERTAAGGTVSLAAGSTVALRSGSVVDLSGGYLNYQPGYAATTQLLGADGKVYNIMTAPKTLNYVGLANSFTQSDSKWGTSTTWQGLAGAQHVLVPGYVEGRDAGALSVYATQAALDGNVLATTVRGPNQRTLVMGNDTTLQANWPVDTNGTPTPPPNISALQYQQAPQGGALNLGAVANVTAQDVVLSHDKITLPGTLADQQIVSQGLAGAPGAPGVAGDRSTQTLVPLDNLVASGVSRISAVAEDTITLAGTTIYTLAPGSSLTLAANRISIDAGITAPSGTVSATAGQLSTLAASVNSQTSLTLAPNAVLNVAGQWVNDSSAQTKPDDTTLKAINAGSIALASQNVLSLGEGSVLDASAGAYLSRSNALTAGTAGSISLAATTASGLALPSFNIGGAATLGSGQADVTLKAYGFSGGNTYTNGGNSSVGGKLNLTVPQLRIGSGAAASGETLVAPAFFAQGGFSKYSLTASAGNLTVDPAASVNALADNLVAGTSTRINLLPTGTAIDQVASISLLPVTLRKNPVSLSLADSFAPTGTQLGVLSIANGASITTDPGGAIQLSSLGRIYIDGELHAPSGTISVSLNTAANSSYLSTQSLWLGPDSQLLAPEVAQVVPDANGVLRGGLINDGANAVTLSASRGILVTEVGSLIDVSGTSAVVDQAQTATGALLPTTLSGNAGSVTLSASEAIVPGGKLRATSGGPTGAGGRLSVTLDGTLAGFTDASQGQPVAVDQITLTAGTGGTLPAKLIPGGTAPASLSGKAILNAKSLADDGFSTIALQSRDQIVLSDTAQLQVGGGITLQAPVIAAAAGANGATPILAAPVVALTNTGLIVPVTPTTPATPSTSTFTVTADELDINGNVAITGFGQTTLQGISGLRTTGIPLPGQSTAAGLASNEVGKLAVAGNLTLDAAQVYPSTSSSFTISAGTQLRIQDSAGLSAAAPLSAGGSLTLAAPTIDQEGVLRAPFGALALSAGQALILGSTSVTSVSGAGLTVPYGTTTNGNTWYGPGSAKLLTGAPAKTIALKTGGSETIASGATIDVSGGGDLQAYEFVKGPGGSSDVLAGPGIYAILPGTAYATSYAPFSLDTANAGSLSVGQAVYLSAGPAGPGTYTLLPAHDALLPGAYAVQISSAATPVPGLALAQADGSTLVAGKLATLNTPFRAAQWSTWQILPSKTVHLLSELDTSLAGQYFPAQAALDGIALPVLPADAGSVQFNANSNIALSPAAKVDFQPASGGRGGEADFSAQNIAVVGTVDTSNPALSGYLQLQASAIDDLGAQRVVLGGTVDASTGALTVGTSKLVVANDATNPLSAPDLVLAATQSLSIAAGSALAGTSTAGSAAAIATTGDGALVRLTGAPLPGLTRTPGAISNAVLSIASGTTPSTTTKLQAAGGLTLDSAGNTVLADSTVLAAPTLRIDANTINLGTAPASGSGVTLSANTLAQASQVVLQTPGSINFNGPLALGSLASPLSSLVLDAPVINAVGPGTREIDAGAITLQSSTAGTIAGLASTLSGTLALHAVGGSQPGSGVLTLGAGNQTLAGMSYTTLSADRAVVTQGSGTLAATGFVDLTSPLVQAAGGSNHSVQAAGRLRATTPGGTAAAQDLGAGGRLSLQGQAVYISTDIEAPAGQISAHATGTDPTSSVALAPVAILDAHGVQKSFQGTAAAIDAGSVQLVSDQHDVILAPGSRIDVGAASGGGAGSLALSAPNGQVSTGGSLNGKADAGQVAGSLSIDTGSLASATSSAASLQSQLAAQSSGGFAEAFSLRTRSGDVAIASATTVQSHSIQLEADQGSIVVNGSLSADADAHHADAGSLALWAGSNLTLAGANLSASAATGNAGAISLGLASASAGQLTADSATRISLSGASTGSLALRVPRSAGGNAISVGNFAPTLTYSAGQAPTVTVEAVKAYQGTALDGTFTSNTASGTPLGDVATLLGNRATILAGLGQIGSLASTTLVPGIEIDNPSQATIGSLDVSQTRFSANGVSTTGVPAILTVRETNGLTITGTVNDAFDATGTVQSGSSWSYRLVAGADLTAANPLGVSSRTSAGDLTLQPTALVRTGTGSISLAAAGNVNFQGAAGAQGSVYTAGAPTDFAAQDPTQLFTNTSAGSNSYLDANGNLEQYTSGGGNVAINAGGDVVGSGGNQIVNTWLYRATSSVVPLGGIETFNGAQTSWWVNFPTFNMNAGALGGGNVTVSAQGNVSNFSAAIPTNGRQGGGDGTVNPTPDGLQILGGGNLAVNARGSILGGSYYVERGTGILRAGGSIAPGQDSASLYAVLLALGDAQLLLAAGGDADVTAAYNPFLVPQSLANVAASSAETDASAVTSDGGYFSTYTANSTLRINSAGGNVDFGLGLAHALTNSAAVPLVPSDTFVSATNGGVQPYYAILPGTLSANALGGSVSLESSYTLSPSSSGNLSLLAGNAVNLTGSGSGVTVNLSNADPSLVPSTFNPITRSGNLNTLANAAAGTAAGPFSRFAAAPAMPLHDGDTVPVTIVADSGSVTGAPGGPSGTEIFSAKPVTIVAGLDVNGVSVSAQNLRATDVTSVQAGRDIVLSPIGSVAVGKDNSTFTVSGPGGLLVSAGRNIDLGSSFGVVTQRNGYQSGSDAGAGIQMYAGLGSCNGHVCAPDFATFGADYINPASSAAAADGNTALLQSYMAQLTGNTGISVADAWSAYLQLSSALQAPLASKVLAHELDLTAVAHNLHGSNYAQGYAAIGTLFPGSVIDAATGKPLTYATQPPVTGQTDFAAGTANHGDISLIYSQVRTLNQGDISLFAPAGGLNVGLANNPKGVPVKSPNGLGIVTQQSGAVTAVASNSINVNASRVFTVGGGDITLWSSFGNVDAGKGAKSVVLVPPPTVTIGADGTVLISQSGATNGSGIGALLTSPTQVPGNVNLIAPIGIVDAGDAGIRAAGNLNIAAAVVLNANNISVGGASTGVPASEPVPISSPPAVSNSTTAAAGASDEAARRLLEGTAAAEKLQAGFKPTIVTVDVLGDEPQAICPAGQQVDANGKCRKK